MQKIIVGSNRQDFVEDIEKHLVEGWKVVPATMMITSIIEPSRLKPGQGIPKLFLFIVLEKFDLDDMKLVDLGGAKDC